jgi:hypothetical protein
VRVGDLRDLQGRILAAINEQRMKNLRAREIVRTERGVRCVE